jgi:hypothetical protein
LPSNVREKGYDSDLFQVDAFAGRVGTGQDDHLASVHEAVVADKGRANGFYQQMPPFANLQATAFADFWATQLVMHSCTGEGKDATI